MNKVQMFILTILFYLALPLLTEPVIAASYECVIECESQGGVIVSGSKCGSSCTGRNVCCEFGGFKNWSQMVWGEDDPPEQFKIMGIEFKTEDLQRIIKTFLIVAVSILVAGLGFVVAYGGIVWVTAGDREEQLQKAKKIMKNGIVGVGIAFGFLAVLGIIAGIFGLDIFNFDFLNTLL